MKRSLMILCASMLVNLTSMAQGNMKYLSRPTIGALPDSWFSGLSGGQIRHIKKPCGALGNIPYILEKYEMPIWITGSKEDKESREKNHQYCDMQTKEVMAELERLKEKEIPASATKDCFISVNAPLRPLRVFNYPAKASYYPYAGIFFYAPYTLKDDAECFWYLKTLAIFISADGYVHISDVIFDGEDGMKGEIKGNVVVGVQVDWRSIYVMNNLSQVIFVHYLKDRYGPAKKKSEEWEKQATRNRDQRRKQGGEEPKPTKNEPECFKFISVAHELLSSKYSQHPPTYEKYGIGRCKHTPKHRGAGSVGIHKTMSPVCFEDNNSIEVTAYKDDETGGIEAVLFRGSPISMKHHLCNIDGDLRSATYVYKGKARSTFYEKGTIDLYANAKCRVEIGEDCSYIVFQRIKNTPKQTEPAKTKKKPEKKPYIKKQWPQGSKPGKIRKNPNIQAAGIGQINAGDTFVIINEQSEWSQVDLDNGTSGWIKNDEIASAKNANDAPDVTPEKTIPSGQAAIEQPDSSLEDFAFINELIHLKDFKKIRERLASEGWNPTEPKDDYAGSIYLGKVFDAKFPKTNSKIHITKKGKKVDITLFLKKINLEAVKGKMKEIEYSYDQSHLNKQNSDRHSFKNPEGYKADLVIFKNSMKPYVSFSAP